MTTPQQSIPGRPLVPRQKTESSRGSILNTQSVRGLGMHEDLYKPPICGSASGLGKYGKEIASDRLPTTILQLSIVKTNSNIWLMLDLRSRDPQVLSPAFMSLALIWVCKTSASVRPPQGQINNFKSDERQALRLYLPLPTSSTIANAASLSILDIKHVRDGSWHD